MNAQTPTMNREGKYVNRARTMNASAARIQSDESKSNINSYTDTFSPELIILYSKYFLNLYDFYSPLKM